MPTKINSCCIIGLDCHLVEVEAEILNGPSSFEIVGLGDTAVQEAKQRVYSAIKNSGAEFPRRRKIINLAPADLKKHGPVFDLPMAIGLLAASGQISDKTFENSLVLGELALSGELKSIKGVLLAAAYAQKMGFRKLFIPSKNAMEAALVPGMEILSINHFIEILNNSCRGFISSGGRRDFPAGSSGRGVKLEEIKGHSYAKRALAVAAAGSHNIIMNGPPGSGKTMLAKALPDILPPLAFDEALEITKIYSSAGRLSPDEPLAASRPFRIVHHTASPVSIIGGGQIPKPGEISLAHRGVLFFDEIAEFPRSVLETLRQPIEDGVITVSRASYRSAFPARFMFVGAMNPCPCGFAGDPKKACACAPSALRKYFKKLSGPLLDRIDIFINVPRLDFEKLEAPVSREETSEIMRGKIISARKMQEARFFSRGIFSNSEMCSKDAERFCQLDPCTKEIFKKAVCEMQLSGRSYFKILKVSRTIADLEGSEEIKSHHLAEALQYRSDSR